MANGEILSFAVKNVIKCDLYPKVHVYFLWIVTSFAFYLLIGTIDMAGIVYVYYYILLYYLYYVVILLSVICCFVCILFICYYLYYCAILFSVICCLFGQMVKYSPDGKLVALCGEGNYTIYSAPSLKEKLSGTACDCLVSRRRIRNSGKFCHKNIQQIIPGMDLSK